MSKQHPIRRFVPMIIGGVVLISVIVFIVHFLMTFKSDPAKKERKIQVISLTKPPPPPPPPPKVEKIPDTKTEKLKEARPEPKPDAPPKSNNDAKPPDGIGKGNGGMATDLSSAEPVGVGNGNGGGGIAKQEEVRDNKMQADRYGHQVVRELEELFADDEDLLSISFKVIVKMWFDREANIQRVEIVSGSNDAEIDKEVQRKLNKVKRFSEVPPEGVASPIKIEFAVGN